MKSFIILISVFLGQALWAQSFEAGNDMQTVKLNGDFTLRCTAGSKYSTRYVYCSDEYLMGGTHQYFLMDGQGKKIDKVNLKSTYSSNGREVKKSVKFDSDKSRSKKRVNLWIETLLQKPMLDYGNNKIEYTAFNGNDVVSSGEFNVNVSLKETRECDHDVIFARNDSDCDFPDRLCDRYFSRQNDCQ
ncbi:MAG: hypothetical protein KDD50_14835 [Bdellovibrionales bacterium]|nr:hypothetical protein [Bdellovibrionales bacterium]